MAPPGTDDSVCRQGPRESIPVPEAVLTHRQTVTVMLGLMLGMFLSSLDQTIVSTSIYTIANDPDGLSLQAWATTAYLSPQP